MPDYKLMAQLLRAVGCGANANEVCVVGNDVFFVKEHPARECAQKYGGELIEIKEAPGWLVKNKPGSVNDDDPLIQAIKKALADEGLLSN